MPTASQRAERCILLAVVVGLLVGLSLAIVPATRSPPPRSRLPISRTRSSRALVLRRRWPFTPDGRLLVTTTPGKLRVYKDGALLANPALDISGKICTNGERGLLGVAVDPNFATNNYIYLYYTFKKHGVCEQNTAERAGQPSGALRALRLEHRHARQDPRGQHTQYEYYTTPATCTSARTATSTSRVGDGGCDYARRLGLRRPKRRLPRPAHPAWARSCA